MRRLLLSAAALVTLGLAPSPPPPVPVRLTLHEGTNIAAALSPDGKTIAFDLLGSIWTMPATGGAAKRITDELMDARQPAWSSDGTKIAFQAYRTSTWNIWSVNADGSALAQLTWGAFDDREPHWSPDRTRIAFSSDRGGTYDVWVLSLASGVLSKITEGQGNEFGPAWSPDGSQIAYVSDQRDAPGVYAVSPTGGTPRLLRATAAVAGGFGPGNAVVATAGPSWSPDGRSIAYNTISSGKSALMVDGVNIAGSNEDVFPFRAQWISANEILYTADGKIKTRAVRSEPTGASAGPQPIEFTADIAFERVPFTPKHREFNRAGAQPVRGILHPSISPDGKQVAFSALGDLWIMPVDGTPRRITNDAAIEFGAAWSPDGRWLAYSSDRSGSMDLWLRETSTGREVHATNEPGAESLARWSPDGSRLAYMHDGGLEVANVSRFVGVDLARDTTPPQPEATFRAGYEPGAASWSPDGKYLVTSALHPNSTRFREGSNEVMRLTVVGGAEKWIDPIPGKSIGMREDFGPIWSPDGTQMAAVIDGRLATFPVNREGDAVGPVRMLSTELANSPSWTGDSRKVLYQADEKLKLVDVVDGSVKEIDPKLTWTAGERRNETSGASGSVSLGATRGGGRATATVVHAGRMWDGSANAARDNMDIVIEGNRITRVFPHSAALHVGTVIDASNETVIPGLIEIHSHLSLEYGDALGRIWLSWGITTVRNPAVPPFEAAAEKEAVESGRRIGPRTFSAGDPIDGTRIYYPGGTANDGGAQLTLQLQRAERLGYDFMKTYVRLPDLLQRRVVEEAHRRGLPVTSHEYYPAMTYGADGVEHIRGTSRRGYSPKQSQLNRSYDDFIQLIAASGMTVTPTVGIQGGFALQTLRDSSWFSDPRMALYPPQVVRTARAAAQAPLRAGDMEQRQALVTPIEQTVARLVRAGGKVLAGTDSPIQPYGLALLREVEEYVSGGLTTVEALRTVTSNNAAALGMSADLGAIAPSHFADLTFIDGNPLANIRDLTKVKRVMKDGVVYTQEELIRGRK